MSFSEVAFDEMKPLSAEEQCMLLQLQRRAQLGPIMHHEFDDGGSDWSLPSEPGMGNMSDASKRRKTEFHDSNLNVSQAYHSAPLMPLPEASLLQGSQVMPGRLQDLGQTKKGTKIAFPPGISSLEEWSLTLIEFGKFSGKNVTYEDLVKASDKESKGYVKWCVAQADAAEGRLRDLSFFLVAFEYVTGSVGQQPLILGTKDVRRFRK